MKRLVFFDGDGTLWYPKSTEHAIAPHWVYSDKKIGKNYLQYLIIIPSALEVLKKLKKLGVSMVLLSTHPHRSQKATKILKDKVKHFKIGDFFDGCYASKDHSDGKGEMIEKILQKRGVPKNQALMVGDSYRYDYLSARKIGVDALLIKTEYMKRPSRGRKVSNTINDIKEVLDFIS